MNFFVTNTRNVYGTRTAFASHQAARERISLAVSRKLKEDSESPPKTRRTPEPSKTVKRSAHP